MSGHDFADSEGDFMDSGYPEFVDGYVIDEIAGTVVALPLSPSASAGAPSPVPLSAPLKGSL